MNKNTLEKIKKTKGAYEYLHNNSRWYRAFYENESAIANFLKEFKLFHREEMYNKVNSTLEKVELISTLIKFVD
jgi:hypothetical protein